MLGPEDDMGRVALVSVAVQDTPLRLELAKEWRRGIRRQDMEGGALQAVRFDPMDRALEDVRSIMIEAQHEAPIHLDAGDRIGMIERFLGTREHMKPPRITSEPWARYQAASSWLRRAKVR